MNTIHNTSENRRKFMLVFFSAVVAAALFIYTVARAGVGQIGAGIRNLGYGFGLILVISSIRYLVRSVAWVLCAEGSTRLHFRDALRARLMGDAIGNLLPFGSFIISEPAKPALIRDRMPLVDGFSAIVIENIFYSISVAVFITIGILTTLVTFHSKSLRLAGLITLVVIASIASLGFFCIRRQIKFLSGSLDLFTRGHLGRKWIDRAGILEDRVYGFYRRHRVRFFPILLLEGAFHFAGVLEVYTALIFISPQHPPTIFTAFILESVNRLITMAFKFVPLRLGVDEAGTGRVSELLQFTESAGVTLAIVRKARDLFWALLGMALLVHRQVSLRNSKRVQAVKSVRYSPEHYQSDHEPDVMMTTKTLV